MQCQVGEDSFNMPMLVVSLTPGSNLKMLLNLGITETSKHNQVKAASLRYENKTVAHVLVLHKFFFKLNYASMYINSKF